MDLTLEVCNVVYTPTQATRILHRLPLSLKLVVREGHNTHDITLQFNERIGHRISEFIKEEIQKVK